MLQRQAHQTETSMLHHAWQGELNPRAPARAAWCSRRIRSNPLPTQTKMQRHLQESAVSQADGDERDLPMGAKLLVVGVRVRETGRPGRAVDAHLRGDRARKPQVYWYMHRVFGLDWTIAVCDRGRGRLLRFVGIAVGDAGCCCWEQEKTIVWSNRQLTYRVVLGRLLRGVDALHRHLLRFPRRQREHDQQQGNDQIRHAVRVE